MMAEFAAVEVEWYSAQFSGLGRDLVARHENELRFRVDEFPDEPRARDPIHFHLLAGNPLHAVQRLSRQQFRRNLCIMTFFLMPLRVACALLVFTMIQATETAPLDTNRIEQITGLKGAWNTAEGVFKVSSPRND